MDITMIISGPSEVAVTNGGQQGTPEADLSDFKHMLSGQSDLKGSRLGSTPAPPAGNPDSTSEMIAFFFAALQSHGMAADPAIAGQTPATASQAGPQEADTQSGSDDEAGEVTVDQQQGASDATPGDPTPVWIIVASGSVNPEAGVLRGPIPQPQQERAS